MKIFLSHYSGEQSEADDIADHLKSVFREQKIEVFMTSSWESIAPGDKWEQKLIDNLKNADILLVLMSIDALGRPWLNFELGVAWAQKIRILILCHKGLSISGLSRPYSSLQAVEIGSLKHSEKLDKVAEALAKSLHLPLPSETPATASLEEDQIRPQSFASTYRSWSLRPAAHIGETVNGRFLVGAVYPSRPDRAEASGLQAGETLYVRLFPGTSPVGRYIQSLVTGEIAHFFERVVRDVVQIDAKLRLAAAFNEDENMVPIIVIDSYEPVPSGE